MEEKLTIYGSGGNRAARCIWTVNELGIEAHFVNYSGLIGSDELRLVHPQAKIPAAIINGASIFESAAICMQLCDLHPEKGLLPASGTKERGSATQWISFAQSEIEAYLWHSFRATRLLPDLKASEFPISFNNDMAKSGLQALSSHMDDIDYLLGEEFSVVDIIVSWTVNWAIKLSLVEPESSLHDYIARLKEREACALS